MQSRQHRNKKSRKQSSWQLKKISSSTINKLNNPRLDFTVKSDQPIMYYDVDLNSVAVSSTEQVYKLLDPLLGTTGILATSDVYAKTIWREGQKAYTSRILLDRVDVRVTATSAYSSLGLPGDLFNIIRMLLIVSPTNYQDSGVVSCLSAVDTHPKTNNVAKVVCDDTFVTQVQAFDSTDRASPGMVFRHYTCPINTRIDCFNNPGNRTLWDTKAGAVILSIISDSTLTPHPTLDMHFRFHFKVDKSG